MEDYIMRSCSECGEGESNNQCIECEAFYCELCRAKHLSICPCEGYESIETINLLNE